MQAWALLTNIPEIAPCLPGAKLINEEGGVYSGAVKVKVGPVTTEYRGTAQFVERDDHNHRAVIEGKGRDSRGAGNANALITAQMHQEGGQTRVDIVTDLKIRGKVAQFGSGVVQDVSEKLLGQFVECLAAKLERTRAPEDLAAASVEDDNDSVGRPRPVEVLLSTDIETSRSQHDEHAALDLVGAAAYKRVVPLGLAIIALIVILVLVLG